MSGTGDREAAPGTAPTASNRASRRSLFWTVATLLLAAAILGIGAQWLVADAVLRPLEARDARTRSELMVTRLAAEFGSPRAPRTEADIESLLAHRRLELGLRPSWVAYRAANGIITSDPPGRARQIEGVLAAPHSPDKKKDGPVRHEILARRAVGQDGAFAGEVLIIRPIRTGPTSIFDTLAPFLFLPIAIIASAIAGLVMVRLLVRRLRALESLAARVSAGDLSARIRDQSGDEIGRVGEQLDAMIDRLAEARARIEADERQRRQLFADITHELATPLTSIRGNADTLLNPAVNLSSDDRDRYIRGIREEARRLDRLTRDLFDLARLEAGATRLVKEPLDWAGLCANTIERFRPRFRDAGLRLEWTGPPGGAWIEADGHRLEQVLENLLANALRYVPKGGSVEVRLAPTSRSRFEMIVDDDGPGLASSDLPHLFDRFYRAPSARAVRMNGLDNAEGSGLGLAIVREVVTKHGGTVHASARSPHGLSIAVALPAQAENEP